MNSASNTSSLLSPKMKMADAINQYHSLLTVLPRLGIPLGFGEKSVEQLCAEHQVSQTLFTLISRVYIEHDYYPSIEELRQCPMQNLIQYLYQSHKDYLENKFPHIEQHLNTLLEPMDKKYSTLIANFYAKFKDELVNHFQFEEEVIFPYMRQFMSENVNSDDNTHHSNAFSEQHDDIEDTLNDLTNLLLKYIPSDVSSTERVDMLLDMYSLSSDIERHAMMEDRILLPYIQYLESQNHD